AYKDRVYLNDTKGGFLKSGTALPEVYVSGSVAVPADYDNDGDLDLFVGGRHTPRNYPLPPKSYLLRNDSTKGNVVFTDVTEDVFPGSAEIGMVTDCTWEDFNGDGKLDLAIAGEWMPLTFWVNDKGKFIDKTDDYGLGKTAGWWYSIVGDDFDHDGDIDFVAGNLGMNYKYQASEKESFDIYADDFDNNMSTDIVLGYYHDGIQFPVRGRQCSSQQIPAIEIKFKDYTSFAKADIEDVYSTESLEKALHYRAYTFASSYIENLGNGKFKVVALPNEAQFSSINNILSEDIDSDGHLDLVLSGNLYDSEVETPRNDASYGMFMKGDGQGNFEAVPSIKSGLYVDGDVKKASSIELTDGQKAFLFAKNNDSLQMVAVRNQP
ncbi:MAG: FG-GAP repeat domain-containing protein, partial [Allomuricauda sp.]